MTVRLRPMEENDIPLKVKWLNDPEVNKYLLIDVQEISEEGTGLWFAEQKNNPLIKLFIIEADQSQAIGYMKLERRRDEPQGELHLLIGEKNCWGKGFGTAAIQAFLRYCFEEGGLEVVFIRVLAENERATKLFKNCGFVEEYHLKKGVFHAGQYHDTIVMGITKENYNLDNLSLNKNILITGCGFLATAVIKRLVTNPQYTLFVLTKGMPQDPYILELIKKGRVHLLLANLTDKDKLQSHKKTLSTIHYLIHLAAVIPEFSSQEVLQLAKENLENNVLGAIHLLELLQNIAYVCFSSSVSVYPQQMSNTNVTEETPTKPETFYGWSKLVAENILLNYARTRNIPVTLLRFTQLYGPQEPHDMFVTRLIKDAQGGELILVNNGVGIKDILFIDDAAEAVILALDKQPPGIYNIASGRGYAIKEIAEEIKNNFSGEVRIMSTENKTESFARVYAISKANRDLSFYPRHSLSGGIRKTVDGLKENDSS